MRLTHDYMLLKNKGYSRLAVSLLKNGAEGGNRHCFQVNQLTPMLLGFWAGLKICMFDPLFDPLGSIAEY